MTSIAKKQSINLLKDFIADILDGDINRLKDFSFLNLNTDIKYHENKYKYKINIEKYGGYFIKKYDKYTLHQYVNDYDDMNLMRAINYLLYNDKLHNLKWEDLNWEYENSKPDYKDYNYRGETINSFNTLINEKFYKDFFKNIKNSQEFINEIQKFSYKIFSIGNFLLLPNKRVGKNSINTYKGFYLGDYSDKFFKHILNKDNKYINELLKENDFWYNEFKKDSDLDKFIQDNYLQDYFTNNQVNYSFNPYYKHWYFDSTQDLKEKEIYATYIRKYITIVTDKINNRANKILKDLKTIINLYN